MRHMPKELKQLLRRFEGFEVSRTKKQHIRIRHPETGDYVIAAGTSSDWRGIKNLEQGLRLLESGVGYQRRSLRQRGLA